MPVIDLPYPVFIPSLERNNDLSSSQWDMNAGQSYAWTLYAPKTGNIDKFSIGIFNIDIAGNADFHFEGVDDNGQPDGVILDASAVANGIAFSAADNATNKVITLASPLAVTQGQLIALVCFLDTAAIDFSDMSNPMHYPFINYKTASSWIDLNRGLHLGLHYDDGTWPHIVGSKLSNPDEDQDPDSWDNLDSPNHRGIRFRLPVPVKVSGAWAMPRPFSQAQFKIILFDKDGASVLAQVTADQATSKSTQPNTSVYPFTSTVQLEMNEWYRLVYLPMHSSNLLRTHRKIIRPAGLSELLSMLPMEMHFTSAHNPTQEAHWTQDMEAFCRMGLQVVGFETE